MAFERSMTDPLIPRTPTDADDIELLSSGSHGTFNGEQQPTSLPSEVTEESDAQRKAKKKRSTWGGETEASLEKGRRSKAALRRGRGSADAIVHFGKIEEAEAEWGEGPPTTVQYPMYLEGDSHSRNSSARTSHTDSMLSTISEEGRVIDGRYTITQDDVHGFVRVEAPNGEDPSSLTRNLELCKRTVLKPYLTFLKAIGWRRINFTRSDLGMSKITLVANALLPSFVFIMLVYASCAQIVSCFHRDTTSNIDPIGNHSLLIQCRSHLVTRLILFDILILCGYLYGLYIFRFKEPENLSSLMERSFLSFSAVKNSQKSLVFTLRFFLLGGFFWVLFSFSLNILRVFSLQLLDNDTFIEWLTPHPNVHESQEKVTRYVMVISSIIGFLFFDLFYVAVVISYVSQCQLLYFYIINIISKVRVKAYSLTDAVKDMRYVYEFLRVLNGKLSKLMSLCLFIFLQAITSTIYGLLYRLDHTPSTLLHLAVTVGVLNLVLWTVLTLLPIVQAARLTSACRKLRRLGLEINSRPLLYARTPQLLLDSFLNHTNSTRYTAKLAQVPVYPWCVVGFWFVFGVVAVFVVTTSLNLRYADWF